MADAIVSVVLQQLTSIIETEIQQEVRLVLGSKKEVEKLSITLTAIQAVLNDAEKKQVKENSVKVWLEELKNVSYDLDDILDEWNTKILGSKIEGIDKSPSPKKKVFSYLTPCSCFNQTVVRRDIGLKIMDIKERLDVIANEKDRYNFDISRVADEPERGETTSLVDMSEVCGRDLDKDTVINKLCESREEESGLCIISIAGMGGIGKTTSLQ